MNVPKRVLCVHDCRKGEGHIPQPEVGCEYTVDYVVSNGWIKDYYVLHEFGYPFAYWTGAFVPLDNEDEETLVEEKELVMT